MNDVNKTNVNDNKEVSNDEEIELMEILLDLKAKLVQNPTDEVLKNNIDELQKLLKL